MSVHIQTQRLLLKPFSDHDRDAILALLTNEQIKQTYMIPDFHSPEQAEKMFHRFQELSLSEDRYVAGMYLNNALIGFLNDVGIHDHEIELGYVVDPRYHNQGYATEALKAVIAHLFRQGFRQISAGAFEDNPASIRVMVKSGMTLLDKTEDMDYRGVTHHCVYYSIQKK